MIDKDYRYEAVKNNTFNLDTVEKSILDSQMSSFKYLYNFQLESTGYKRFDFKMTDMQRSNTINHLFRLMPRRWVLYIEDDFIHEGKRLTYKRSSLYEKEITYLDTLNNRNVFSSTFLVFIDGKAYFEGVNLICKEDKTYMVFNLKEKPRHENGIDQSVFEDYMDRNVDVTIYFIPNYNNVSVSTNAYALKDYNILRGLPYNRIGMTNIPKNENVLSFVKYSGKITGDKTNLNFDQKGIFVDDKIIKQSIKNNPKDTLLDLNILDFKHLLKIVDIPAGEGNDWFELPIQDYPIAVGNCMIFDTDGNYMHEIEIDTFYPNIYHIRNNTKLKGLQIYVFYFKSDRLLQHKNSLETFYKYTKNVVELYRFNTIPELIKNYNPVEITYNIKDYKNSQYFDNHFKYKVEKMREIVKLEPEYFKTYLINLGLKNNYYYVDLTKVDLSKKIRNDNGDTNQYPLVIFDEPMYMFVFRNDFRGLYDELLVSLDGLRYHTKHLYKTDKFDFLYIPISMVKNDSILEIEKLKETVREYKFKGQYNKLINIELDDKVILNEVLLNDLFIVDPVSNKYIDVKDYEMYVTIDGELKDVSNLDLFIKCPKTIGIKIMNKLLDQQKLVLHIKKNFRYFLTHTQTEAHTLDTIKFNLDGKNDSRHIRLYRNGMLVPRHIKTCRFPEEYFFSETQLFPGMIREIGDEFRVESMPYKMRQVCYLERINSGRIIDLDGMLDKPFDFKWFDLYLNGRKLARRDVEIISANKIIVRHTESLAWLEIIENIRDKEYFGYKPINDIIDDLINSDLDFRDRIESTINPDDMTDIEDPVVTEIIRIVDVILHQFYYNYMIPNYGLLNPDNNQISEDTQRKYIDIMDGEPFLINPDYGKSFNTRILPINPDN